MFYNKGKYNSDMTIKNYCIYTWKLDSQVCYYHEANLQEKKSTLELQALIKSIVPLTVEIKGFQ